MTPDLLQEVGCDIGEVVVPDNALMRVGAKQPLKERDKERGGAARPGCVHKVLRGRRGSYEVEMIQEAYVQQAVLCPECSKVVAISILNHIYVSTTTNYCQCEHIHEEQHFTFKLIDNYHY